MKAIIQQMKCSSMLATARYMPMREFPGGTRSKRFGLRKEKSHPTFVEWLSDFPVKLTYASIRLESVTDTEVVADRARALRGRRDRTTGRWIGDGDRGRDHVGSTVGQRSTILV